jgi:hypothetical protein
MGSMFKQARKEVVKIEVEKSGDLDGSNLVANHSGKLIQEQM